MPALYLVAAITFAVVGYLAKVCDDEYSMLCAELTSIEDLPGGAAIASREVARDMALQIHQSRLTLPHFVRATDLLRGRTSPKVRRRSSNCTK
jgi:hypothetical protein